MTIYLTSAEVLEIHADQIRRYGGASGIRDPGLLQSALARPQSGYYANLIDEAAALWESLSQNHPFIDGNKRTAFAATYTFLVVNGARWDADTDRTERFVLGAYASATFNFEHLSDWLKTNVTPAESPS